MTFWVETNPHIILWLVVGDRRATFDRVVDRTAQVIDANLQMQLHLLTPGPAGQVGRTWSGSYWQATPTPPAGSSTTRNCDLSGGARHPAVERRSRLGPPDPTRRD